MKAAIYQFWEGNLSIGNKCGTELMREYADRIGVDYIFELNPSWPEDARLQRKNLGRYNPHYGAFKPIFDKAFDTYDYILFCDTDVVPRYTIENIFDEFAESGGEIGVCEEWMQPGLRTQHNIGGIHSTNDKFWHRSVKEKYGTDMDLDAFDRPKVYNSGCVLYSRKGRKKAQDVFVDFKEYTNHMSAIGLPPFYQGDQNYLGAMLPLFDWTKMNYKWNSQMFYEPGTKGDNRPIADFTTQETNFVHIQLRGADDYDMDTIKKVIKYDQR